MSRRRSCECGTCKVCCNREASRKYYQAHREEVIPRNKLAREKRKGGDYEMKGTKELDERGDGMVEILGV